MQRQPRREAERSQVAIDAPVLFLRQEGRDGKQRDAIEKDAGKGQRHGKPIAPCRNSRRALRKPEKASVMRRIPIEHQPIARAEAQAAQQTAEQRGDCSILLLAHGCASFTLPLYKSHIPAPHAEHGEHLLHISSLFRFLLSNRLCMKRGSLPDWKIP